MYSDFGSSSSSFIPPTNKLSFQIVESVLNGLYDAISTVLRKNVEKKALIDAMDTCILIIDEICDEGFVLEFLRVLCRTLSLVFPFFRITHRHKQKWKICELVHTGFHVM